MLLCNHSLSHCYFQVRFPYIFHEKLQKSEKFFKENEIEQILILILKLVIEG